MRILVIGYGRLGRKLVRQLDTQKHEVVVLDKERSVLERSDRDPRVRYVMGNAIDQDALRDAGAEKADVLFALTRDENTNLMVAQTARIIFQVPHVVAVVYDPAREPQYRAAGIDTMALTVAGADFLVSKLEGGPGRPATFQDAWAKTQGRSVEAATVPLRSADTSGPLYAIIVGGGRVGYFLGRALLENNLEVTIIESDKRIFDLVSHQLDCPVIQGDGSSTAVLEQAGASRCNVFVAVTNHDQDNLIACQIAKQHFGVPKTIARVKNPKNEALMQKMGVDITVSSTAIITGAIQSELPSSRIRQVLDLRMGELELMEYVLDTKAPAVGKRLRDLAFPPDCNIVTVFRAGEAVIPRGDTCFQQNDTVMVLVKMSGESNLRKMLLGP
ncbi:MAG TPA: NAD-binding protein [Candidatus Acidoferrales bacterium]